MIRLVYTFDSIRYCLNAWKPYIYVYGYTPISIYMYICRVCIYIWVYKSIYTSMCMYMCLLIWFDYTFNSIYATVFIYGRIDFERLCLYDFRKDIWLYKGFLLGRVKGDFMKLGQKSINSCKGPFASSILHIATSYKLRARKLIMTS